MGYRCPIIPSSMCRVSHWRRATASFCASRPQIPNSTAMRRDGSWKVSRRGRSLTLSPKKMTGRSSRLLTWGCLALCVILTAGCPQEMANQPKYKPYAPSPFFGDGRSARPLVEGTVARGQARLDAHLYTGKIAGTLADTLPFPVTDAHRAAPGHALR